MVTNVVFLYALTLERIVLSIGSLPFCYCRKIAIFWGQRQEKTSLKEVVDINNAGLCPYLFIRRLIILKESQIAVNGSVPKNRRQVLQFW